MAYGYNLHGSTGAIYRNHNISLFIQILLGQFGSGRVTKNGPADKAAISAVLQSSRSRSRWILAMTLKAQYIAPTRRNSTVESRRRRWCLLGLMSWWQHYEHCSGLDLRTSTPSANISTKLIIVLWTVCLMGCLHDGHIGIYSSNYSFIV